MNREKTENLTYKQRHIAKHYNNTSIVDGEDFCWIFFVTLKRKAYDGEEVKKVFYAYSHSNFKDENGIEVVTVWGDMCDFIEDRYGEEYYYKIDYKIHTVYYESEIIEGKWL